MFYRGRLAVHLYETKDSYTEETYRYEAFGPAMKPYTIDEIYQRGEIYQQQSKVLAYQLTGNVDCDYAALGIRMSHTRNEYGNFPLLEPRVKIRIEGIDHICVIGTCPIKQNDWIITDYPWVQGEVPLLRNAYEEDFEYKYIPLGIYQECRFDFLEGVTPLTISMQVYRCIREIRAIQNPFGYPIQASGITTYYGDEDCWLCEPIYTGHNSFERRCGNYRRPEHARLDRFVLPNEDFCRAYLPS